MRAEEVAVAGDDPKLRMGAHEIAGLIEVVGDHHPGQQPGERAPQFPRRLHKIKDGQNAWRVADVGAARRCLPGVIAGDDQLGASGVRGLELRA